MGYCEKSDSASNISTDDDKRHMSNQLTVPGCSETFFCSLLH